MSATPLICHTFQEFTGRRALQPEQVIPQNLQIYQLSSSHWDLMEFHLYSSRMRKDLRLGQATYGRIWWDCKAIRICSGWRRPVSDHFRFKVNYKSIRTCSELPLTASFHFTIRICSGLPQKSFLLLPFRLQFTINYNVLCAVSKQFPLIANHNLIKNRSK